MEQCDVRDASGKATGKTVVRGTKLRPGEYYLAVQVWVRNENGEYLAQQRALHLTSGPGIWATTVGLELAGEESLPGAIREIREELGLQLLPDQMKLFERLRTSHQIEDVWLADVSKDLTRPEIGSEVAAWRWASKATLRQMIQAGEFFAYSYFDRLPG